MKNLTEYLYEKLVVNKNYNPYTYVPKSFNELRKIIEQRYKEQGPGTEQNPINFNDVDVSRITSFYNESNDTYAGIFEETEFEYIDISDWDVSNIEDMSNMFYECENLKSIGDISNWDVSKVEDMRFMFGDCSKLELVGNLSNWNVSKVEDMSFMFGGCAQLKSVGDLSDWNVSKVKYMTNMLSTSAITNIPDWYKG